MQLRHFKCPSCGANLDVSADRIEIKCDYCDQTFVIDDPNAIVAEMGRQQQADHKVKMMVFIGVALFIGLITIAVVLFTAIAPNGFGKDTDENDAMFSTMTTVSAEIPTITVEKDYYTFRTESVRQINYDKHGIEMGFSSPIEYEAGANEVIADPATLTRIASDGCRIYYHEETNFFVKLYDDGAIRLFISPIAGKGFFENN